MVAIRAASMVFQLLQIVVVLNAGNSFHVVGNFNALVQMHGEACHGQDELWTMHFHMLLSG